MSRRFIMLGTAVACCAMLVAGISSARSDDNVPELRAQDGRFQPQILNVAANSTVQLKVVNLGSSAIEFESFELNRERVVPPGKAVTVYLPSLAPGTYHFFDDFHRDTQGTLVVK